MKGDIKMEYIKPEMEIIELEDISIVTASNDDIP